MSKIAEQIVKFSFDAAHELPGHPGKCRRLHGHTWKGRLVVRSSVDEGTGMGLDFIDLKRIVDETVPDHAYLNELVPTPTCEALAEYLVLLFRAALPATDAVVEIELWESDRCGVRVRV